MTTPRFRVDPYKIKGTIAHLQRQRSSPSGNPRWLITLKPSDMPVQVYATAEDTACAYGIDAHHRGREVLLTINSLYHVIGYELTEE